MKRNNDLGADQAVATDYSASAKAGGEAALALGTKAVEQGGLSKEDAVIGTLGVVAAAAGPIVPWGTVASVVIMAGIAVYKGMSAANKAEIQLNNTMNNLQSQFDYLKVIKSTIEQAGKRPKMPLDLYSGPPMYWIVPSPDVELNTNARYYNLPNGSVYWPCADQGGFSPMANTNKTNVNTDDIYAPFKPNKNNNPTICIFFWAVPIFFARMQQLLGEQIFGGVYDPKSIDPKSGKTVEVVLADIIKGIINQGRLDSAGNWYAKIGPVIPALAFDDDDYAARYYGRNTWVHNLALQNIKYADGSRIADSGVKYAQTTEYFSSATAKQAIALSNEYATEKPHFVAVAGKPYYLANSLVNAPTPVLNSGQVLDLYGLVSHYDKWDGSFKNSRDALRASPGVSDDTLYYVVSIPTNLEFKRTSIASSLYSKLQYAGLATVVGGSLDSRWKDNDNLEGNSTLWLYTTDIYSTAIRNAGGFNQVGLSSLLIKDIDSPRMDPASSKADWNMDFLASRIHGKFALAPFQLYIQAKCEQFTNDNMPRPYIGPPYTGDSAIPDTTHSSYGFFDFDPEPFAYTEVVGLWDGAGNMGRFDWIRNLSIMCGYKADVNSKSDEFKYSAAIAPTKLENQSNSAADRLQVHMDIDLSDISAAGHNETFYYRTFNIPSSFSGINEIVKLRPPMTGEPTIKLRKEFWGEGEPWAKLQGKDEVDFAIINSPKLMVFSFKREPLIALTSLGQPLTRAYYRTNLEENKPIVELEGKSNPSPFYCGRRADPRTKWAWRKIRLATTGQSESSKDTGWEDCHEWSWPYPTPVLAEIGRVSNAIYKDLGEGIGRAGLSISSIATGPTLWGDVSLYISRYSALKGSSSSIGTKGFEKLVAQTMWQSIIEMQTGAYSRYSYLANNLNSTFADDVQKQFSTFTNNSKARQSFLDQAKSSSADGVQPRKYNDKTGAPIYMTPDQAADYCMSIIDAWFNGTFPKPNAEFQKIFQKKDWDADVLDKVARAHIRLKNWAIDLGLPDNQKKGHKFPSDAYSINFFGLNKANKIAIEAYNSAVDANAMVTNPLSIGITQTFHYDSKETVLLAGTRKKPLPVFLNPPVMVTAAATLATVALLARMKGKK